MGNCMSADEKQSSRHHYDRHSRASSPRRRRHSPGSRPSHRSRNYQPDGFELSPHSVYVGPTQHAGHGETGNEQHDEYADIESEIQQLSSSFPNSVPFGPHQPTRRLHFPVTFQHETLERWGYVVYPKTVTGTDGRIKEYHKIMYVGDGETRAHHVAEVRISPDDELAISLIDTENEPGLSRPRTRASNILVAFWTGSGREVTLLRGLRFENVIEESTREEVAPRAYGMLGLSLFENKLRIGREQREVFEYVAETSRLARVVWSMLQCQEMRDANVQMTEFCFRTIPVRSSFIPAEYTPFHFDIRLGIV